MTSIITDFEPDEYLGDGDFFWDTDRFKVKDGLGYNYFNPTYGHWGAELDYVGVDSLDGHTLTITQADGSGSYTGNNTQFTHFAIVYSGSTYDDLTDSDLIAFSGSTGTVGPLTSNIEGILFILAPADFFHYSSVDVMDIEKDELSPPVDECPCPAWTHYNGTEEICVTP